MTAPLPAAVIDGIPSFAPSLAHSDAGFDPDAFKALAELEPKNFWFRSRNELLKWAARRYFPDATAFHEIGCGTGFVLLGLRAVYPGIELSGSEINVDGLVQARSRLPDVTLMQMDARDIPFRSRFDLMGAFDVLEHIDDDAAVLQQIHAALRPRGGLLLTVPQHDRLWSVQDVRAHHRRRYSRAGLERKLRDSGFEIQRTTSFVSLLLPAMLLNRRLDRRTHVTGTEALRAPNGTDWALGTVLAFERLLIRVGASFPAGGSLLVVASRSE